METVRRDWCELTSITLNRVLELVLIEGDVDQAVEYVRQIVSKVRNLDPAKDSEIVESLVLTRTLTRKIESYKNKQPHLTVAENLKKKDWGCTFYRNKNTFCHYRRKRTLC